jgi:methionyl-tRNA synthetase
LLNCIRTLTILLAPILVNSTKEIAKQLNFTAEQLSYKNVGAHIFKNTHKINGDNAPIFMRYTEAKVE